MSPADIAENLMTMSKKKKMEPNECLTCLVEVLKQAKEDEAAARVKEVEEAKEAAAKKAKEKEEAEVKKAKEEDKGKDKSSEEPMEIPISEVISSQEAKEKE